MPPPEGTGRCRADLRLRAGLRRGHGRLRDRSVAAGRLGLATRPRRSRRPLVLGVLLTIVAIAISASAGVAAEQRWPATAVSWARRLLVISLYTLIPFVVFFNLDRAHLNADLAGGLVTGWVAILSAVGLAWVAGSRLLRLARPSTGTLISTTAVPNSGYLGYPLCGLPARLPCPGAGRRLRRDRRQPLPVAARVRRRGELRHPRWREPEGAGDRLFHAQPSALRGDRGGDRSRPLRPRRAGGHLTRHGGRAAADRLLRRRRRVRRGGGGGDPRPRAHPSARRSERRSCCGLPSHPGSCFCSHCRFIDLPGPYLLLAAMPCGDQHACWSPTSTASTRSWRRRPSPGPLRSRSSRH